MRPKTHDKGCGKLYVDQRSPGRSRRRSAHYRDSVGPDRHADAIEATARELESEAARLDLAIADAESVAEALSDRLGRGEITLSRYDIAVRPLDERLSKLKAERDALGDTPSQRPQRASREHWQRRWNSAEKTEERRALLKMALRGRRIIVAMPQPPETCPRGRRHPPNHDRVGVFTRPTSGWGRATKSADSFRQPCQDVQLSQCHVVS